MKDLGEARVVCVTGGTSGVGLALVEASHARGDRVWFCARSPDRVAQLRERLPGTQGYVCDVTIPGALAQMAASLQQAAGRLDVLIANVGAMHAFDFKEAPLDASLLQSDIDLNLTSAVLTVNAFLPLLKASTEPHVVIIGSGYGWSPAASAPLYSAAKAGIRAFVKALRAQLRTRGVHVMEVVPPMVDTPAVADKSGRKLAPARLAQATLEGIERRRPAVFVGKTRWIPLMLRLAPAALERITLAG